MSKSGPKSSGRDECVKVAVRCRPVNSMETSRGEKQILQMDKKRGSVALIKNENQPVVAEDATGDNKLFTFDYCYPPGTAQIEIYDQTARPIVESVLQGYNGTIFAYGQTGTGKTFTMEGVPDDDNLRGIMPNSFIHLFEAVKSAPPNVEFMVRASFLEIYLDEVYDLLKPDRTKMDVKESKEKGVFVKDLSELIVKSAPDLMKVLRAGQKTRKVGATKMNEGSSRSHSLLMVTVEASEKDAQEEVHYRKGKLNLVDLAGSERQKRTEAQGERLDEAKAINLSLSALGNVIKALINPNAKHIPFRDSKLTRLLQDSLGGNTRTVMIANLSPGELSYDETLSTLRYANRAKNIKNKPKINEDPKDAMLREYQEEIQRLKTQLASRRQGLNSQGVAMGEGADGTVTYVDGEQVIEENVIVKEIIKETGITAEHIAKIKEKEKLEEDILKAKSEKEKDALMKKKNAVEGQVKLYEEEIKRKHDQLELEKAEFDKLQAIIKAKESQLLQGEGELDKAQKNREELQRAEEELMKRRADQEKVKKELEEAKLAEELLKGHASSKESELANKAGKIKQLMKKYEDNKNKIIEQREEWEDEKSEIVESIRALDRQLKLKQLILSSFIPSNLIYGVQNACRYDTLNDEWRIPGQELAGNNIERMGGSVGNMGEFRSRADQIQGNPEESVGGGLSSQLFSYQTYRQNSVVSPTGAGGGRR